MLKRRLVYFRRDENCCKHIGSFRLGKYGRCFLQLFCSGGRFRLSVAVSYCMGLTMTFNRRLLAARRSMGRPATCAGFRSTRQSKLLTHLCNSWSLVGSQLVSTVGRLVSPRSSLLSNSNSSIVMLSLCKLARQNPKLHWEIMDMMMAVISFLCLFGLSSSYSNKRDCLMRLLNKSNWQHCCFKKGKTITLPKILMPELMRCVFIP